MTFFLPLMTEFSCNSESSPAQTSTRKSTCLNILVLVLVDYRVCDDRKPLLTHALTLTLSPLFIFIIITLCLFFIFYFLFYFALLLRASERGVIRGQRRQRHDGEQRLHGCRRRRSSSCSFCRGRVDVLPQRGGAAGDDAAGDGKIYTVKK